MMPHKDGIILYFSSEEPQAKRAIALRPSDEPPVHQEMLGGYGVESAKGEPASLTEALQVLSERVSRLHIAHVMDVALEVAQRVTCAAIEIEPKVLYALIDKHLQGLRGEVLHLSAGVRAFGALSQVIDDKLREVVASITLDEEAAPWSVRLEIPPGGRLELGPLSQVEAVRRVWFPEEGEG